MSVMTNMIDTLNAAGLNAYLPGRHQGQCLKPYTVIEDGGTEQVGKTTGRHVYLVTVLVPLDAPTRMQTELVNVQAALKAMPFLKIGEKNPDFIDEDKNAYCVALEYSALCSLT